jgi:hypothetical protein
MNDAYRALYAAASRELVDVALERTWCRACRTECRTHSRSRDTHPHAAECVLARTPVMHAHAEADMEQALHNERFQAAQEISEWLRTIDRVRGVLISIHSSQDIARLADAIARMDWDAPKEKP